MSCSPTSSAVCTSVSRQKKSVTSTGILATVLSRTPSLGVQLQRSAKNALFQYLAMNVHNRVAFVAVAVPGSTKLSSLSVVPIVVRRCENRAPL